MRITLIHEAALPPSVWSGGSSRQLCIYPPEAVYGAKNFLVRMSTAISTSEDEFPYTPLPGITRHLLMLEGTARITHGGAPPLTLKPLETIDIFNGGLETRCAGRVKDFNLMLGAGAAGSLRVWDQDGRRRLNPPGPPGARSWIGLYCVKGRGTMTPPGQRWEVESGGFLLVEDLSAEDGDITFLLEGNAQFVHAKAWIAENAPAR